MTPTLRHRNIFDTHAMIRIHSTHARISSLPGNLLLRSLAGMALCALSVHSAPAAESQTAPAAGTRSEMLEELTPEARKRAAAVLEASPCLCGCRLDLAVCALEHPDCSRSSSIGKNMARLAAEGASEEDLKAYVRTQPILPRPRLPSTNRQVGQSASSVLEATEHTFTIDSSAFTGPVNAPVTIIEFSDFQCGFCAKSQQLLKTVLARYPEQVRLVYKHFPLPSHEQARGAAMAAMAAQAQDQFWAMHDLLFANRTQLDQAAFLRFASQLQLDMDRFEQDLQNPAFMARVNEDIVEGRSARLPGTPSFYVNGRKLQSNSMVGFQQAIAEALRDVEVGKALHGWCPVPSR
ncbi:MAG: DsbA family protein [Acidobacteria bacterium]|nr:DsbA family protein [Acidobacteriota bacterium]